MRAMLIRMWILVPEREGVGQTDEVSEIVWAIG